MAGGYNAGKTGDQVDVILDRLEAAAKQVETSVDAQVVPKAEEDLLTFLADLKVHMEGIAELGEKDDLAPLQECFGGDCKRVGRTRAILEGLRFEEKTPHDAAKQQCMTALQSIEKVVESSGNGEQLKKAQETERKALFERIRLELDLFYKAGEDDDDDVDSEVWDDHPDPANMHADLSMLVNPTELSGHLWKKSPSGMVPMRQWKWRWFVLAEGKLKWFGSESEANSGNRKALKGEVDFSLNACNIAPVANSATQFSIRPHGGKWMLGAFTGADDGREFLLDAFSSQYDRDQWINAIKTNLKHGAQSYGGTRLSFMGK